MGAEHRFYGVSLFFEKNGIKKNTNKIKDKLINKKKTRNKGKKRIKKRKEK
jgi:hypothetical protein